MAKGQKKTNREVRKPKKGAPKKPLLADANGKTSVKTDIKS